MPRTQVDAETFPFADTFPPANSLEKIIHPLNPKVEPVQSIDG
jgi:hypothetical protein